jgi:hypothetical protein
MSVRSAAVSLRSALLSPRGAEAIPAGFHRADSPRSRGVPGHAERWTSAPRKAHRPVWAGKRPQLPWPDSARVAPNRRAYKSAGRTTVGSASPWAAKSAKATKASCSSTFASARNEEGIQRINATRGVTAQAHQPRNDRGRRPHRPPRFRPRLPAALASGSSVVGTGITRAIKRQSRRMNERPALAERSFGTRRSHPATTTDVESKRRSSK